jgi:hypothetical protein
VLNHFGGHPPVVGGEQGCSDREGHTAKVCQQVLNSGHKRRPQRKPALSPALALPGAKLLQNVCQDPAMPVVRPPHDPSLHRPPAHLYVPVSAVMIPVWSITRATPKSAIFTVPVSSSSRLAACGGVRGQGAAGTGAGAVKAQARGWRERTQHPTSAAAPAIQAVIIACCCRQQLL